MVKTAYLVLAHRQPAQCRRLINALVSDRARVFVHVDSKVDPRPFKLEHPQVCYIRRRVNVNRGGWSLTRAMMTVLRTAYRCSDCGYFVFLAATDYPIKPRKEIESVLAGSYPLNIINYFPFLEGTAGISNLTRYHFVDESCWLANLLGTTGGAATERDAKFPRWVNRINDWLPPRRFPAGSVPFRGSDRWCLNRDTVRHILESWSSTIGWAYRRYLRYAWGSDEILFQTIVFNSRFREQCRLWDGDSVQEILDGRREPWPDEVKTYFHHIDWDPEREDPAILDERDYAALEKSPMLFACKFDEDRSARLLEHIDRDLRGA
jgi:Core-2/I-Branching enzyme